MVVVEAAGEVATPVCTATVALTQTPSNPHVRTLGGSDLPTTARSRADQTSIREFVRILSPYFWPKGTPNRIAAGVW